MNQMAEFGNAGVDLYCKVNGKMDGLHLLDVCFYGLLICW